jgi:tetratricopeptide (TPR) repeat protein
MIKTLKNIMRILALFFCLNMMGQNNNEYYKKAITYASNKNIEEALNNINKAINIEGHKVPPLFYFHKYEYFIKLHKFELAIETLNDALYILPHSVLLLNARADFFFALKMYKKAILDYQKIVRLVKEKELIEYNLKLGSTKFLVRDFEGSAIVLQDVIKEDPSNIDALNLLASLHIELFEYIKAEQILHKLINEHPSQVFTIINLGFVYQKKQQHEEAISCFDSALKLDPDNPIALSNRAYSKFRMSNIDEAILDINKSIDLLPSNSYAYMIRGKIYLSLSKTKEACFNFKIAEKLNFSEQYGPEVNELINKSCQ